MHGVLVLCALLWTAPTAAQSASEPDERDGPYRSRMRIVDERTPVVPTQAPTDTEFASALNARAKGYLAARQGDTNEAIAQLRAALDTGVLAPIAARAVVQDMLALLARAEQHEQVMSLYRQQRPLLDELDPQVSMAVAQSAVATGQLALALSAIDNALKQGDAPLSWQRYKVYVLTKLERYAEAAALGARHLPLTDTEPANWRNLIELQRAAEQPRLAVATAELAFDRGVLVSTDDVLQLARLYLATGLPDHAAVALNHHHTTSPPGNATLSMLLRAQRGAGSLRDAVATARQLSRLSDSPDHLLMQAQLEHELGDLAASVVTLRRALRKDLGSRRGQALLLLGENQVATGALRQARRAFREASELGGVYRDALAWLARLDELKAEVGQTPGGQTPGGETPGDLAAGGAAPDAAVADNMLPDNDDAARSSDPSLATTELPLRPAAELDIQRLPRLQFFHASAEATLDSLPEVASQLQRRVGIGLRRERLSAAGPLRWRADGRALIEGRGSTIELGVPVRTRVPPRGRFKNIDLPPLTAAVRTYSGEIGGLGEAWRQLTADVVAAGHTPGSDARTVIMAAPDSRGDGGRFELQLEILETR